MGGEWLESGDWDHSFFLTLLKTNRIWVIEREPVK